MKLDKLIIDNFRCFKHYEIEFASGITVLIGKNGTGKSSLIHAIRYALSFLLTKKIKTESNDKLLGEDYLSAGNPDLNVIDTSFYDFYRNSSNGEAAGYLQIHGEASFNSQKLSWDMYKQSPVKTKAAWQYSKFSDAYHSFMKEYRNSNSLPLFAYYSDSYPHKEEELTLFARETVKEQGTIIRNFGYYHWDEETACTFVWEKRFINALIKHINLQDKDISTATEVNFIKDRLRAVSKAINETEDSDFEIDELHPAFDDTDLPVLYVRMKNGQDIAFPNLPAGYKRLYSIVLDIAYRAYILNKGNLNNIQGIAIIDEIDLHLHPSLEQEVLQRLQQTFPTIQFIVSTHSPLVITNLDLEQGRNSILRMSLNNKEPHRLPDIYGIDYNSGVLDFMETPNRNVVISELTDSILRLIRIKETELVEERKNELRGLVSEKRYQEIMQHINDND